MVQSILITISQVIVLSLSYYYLQNKNQVKDFQKEITMIRHGARSPNKYTDLDKKLWKDFPPGYLTEKGFQQHVELGQTYMKKNIYEDGQICSTDNFNFIVSSKPRVLLSFIGFMQGACPYNYVEILKNYFTINLKQHSVNNQTFNAIIEQNFQYENQSDLEIFKMKSDMLFHGHSDDQCPILADIDNNVLQTEEYKNKEKDFLQRPQFKEVLLKMQKSNPSLQQSQVTINKMKTFFGGYKCNQYQGLEEPQLSKEAQEYLSEIFIYKFYNMDNSNKIQHLSALTEIFKWIISRLNDDKQTSLYFGHDSNQVAVASVILETPIIFPFASKFSFIITGEYVNLKFQDTILPQKMCKTKFNCTKRQVIEFLRQYISSDLQKLCNN